MFDPRDLGFNFRNREALRLEVRTEQRIIERTERTERKGEEERM